MAAVATRPGSARVDGAFQSMPKPSAPCFVEQEQAEPIEMAKPRESVDRTLQCVPEDIKKHGLRKVWVGLGDSEEEEEEDGEQAAIPATAGASTTDDEADEEVFPLGKASHHAESLAVVVGAKRADHASTSAECQVVPEGDDIERFLRQADQVRGSGLAWVYFHCGGSMVWLKGV